MDETVVEPIRGGRGMSGGAELLEEKGSERRGTIKRRDEQKNT